MPSSFALARLLAVGVGLVGLVACGGPPLDSKFVLHIEQGWSCGTNGYVGLDKHEKVRMEVNLPLAEIRFPDFTTGASILVYTGKHLIEPDDADPCDGSFDGEDVELDFLYTAVDGVAKRYQNGPGVGITVDQLVLEPDPQGLGVDGDGRWDRLDDVTVEHYEFPAFSAP